MMIPVDTLNPAAKVYSATSTAKTPPKTPKTTTTTTTLPPITPATVQTKTITKAAVGTVPIATETISYSGYVNS